MTYALSDRLADWKILLARGAISGARLDAASVRELIGLLIACEVEIADRPALTIDLMPDDYHSAEEDRPCA